MSDNITSTTSSVDLSLAASQAGMAPFVQASSNKASNVESQEPSRPNEAQVKPESSSDTAVVNNLVDFSFEFKVDKATNDITVYILDRASHEVVRTIPPEELMNLNPGDLLQLFA
ncbi:MAG: flagellar protein FlaG [Anaerolineaceae bacterium]